uniref:Uncharacterized protein n=1 Tax=Anopheles farauti TaxID=69004 RepID=A0A182QSW3_9DIPT
MASAIMMRTSCAMLQMKRHAKDIHHRNEQQQQVDARVQIEEIVRNHLAQVGRHEYEVHAAEAELRDDEKHVDQIRRQLRVAAQSDRSGLERPLADVGEAERWHLQPAAQFVRAVDQHMHAVRTDGAHEERPEQPDVQTGVLECVRHGENTGPDVALQQVNHRVEVGRRMFEGAVHRRFVRFAGGRAVHGVFLIRQQAVRVVRWIHDHVFRGAAQVGTGNQPLVFVCLQTRSTSTLGRISQQRYTFIFHLARALLINGVKSSMAIFDTDEEN